MQENIPQEFVQPKNSNFLVSLLSVLLLLSCIIAGFFAYQTQQLVKELRVTRDELRQTPTPTPTPDPTADWKTYVNTSSSYSIRYHPSWKVENMAAGFFEQEPGLDSKYIQMYFSVENNKVATINIEEQQLLVPTEENGLIFEKKIGDSIAKCQNIKTDYRQCSIKVPNKQKYLSILSYLGQNEVYDRTVDQILSTFKFIEPVTSSSPLSVACTMEVKICPDGSYVGRVGPKCEFAPCPTLKP